MKNTTTLIVLGSTKFGESSVVVHTLSPLYGRRSFLVRMGKKTSPAMLLPMSLLEASVAENPRATLWTANSLSVRNPLPGIRGNMYKNTISLFISEVLYRTIKDGDFEEGLYEWCEKSILTLEELGNDFSNFHIRFLLELADELGFRPSFADMAPFAGDLKEEMRAMMKADFSGAMLVPLNGEQRNALCESILRYLEFHTESTINVKSLAVLREIFG